MVEPITLALAAAASLFLLKGKSGGSSSGARDKFKATSHQDRLKYLEEVRSMSQWYSNRYGSMPDLADFLTIVGFIESRFNPAAANPEISSNPSNAARGLFGFRPNTAFRSKNGLESLRSSPNLLYNPRWSFVCAVFHVYDADRTASRKGYQADWVAVRRWWGYPSKLDDFDMVEEFSQNSLRKFDTAVFECNNIYGTNVDPDFMWNSVRSGGFPGMEVLLKDFGLRK